MEIPLDFVLKLVTLAEAEPVDEKNCV